MKAGLCLLLSIAITTIAMAQAASPQWKRHTIDAGSRGADGVRLADINGDGLPDCVTGWEEGGAIRVCVHPGHTKAKQAWPVVEVGRVKSPEDAVFADVDGDGNTDVVSCCEGKQRCLFLHMAPENARLLEADAWRTVPIESSRNWQWMYALPCRINGDNRTDFFAGAKGPDACIAWFTASEDARDGNAWKMHRIASAGWIMSMFTRDMNGDGLDDLVVSDRRGETRGIHWFEHPGRSAVTKPWKRHTLGGANLECMFLTLTDLDKDGRTDVVCNVKGSDILFLRNNGELKNWETHRVGHNLRTGGGKGIAVDDVNGDGINDLLLTCESANGKIGAFWLQAKKSVFDRTWIGHDISGTARGVKYDLIQLIDLDGDGDRDLLTCEERDNLGVVWYERP